MTTPVCAIRDIFKPAGYPQFRPPLKNGWLVTLALLANFVLVPLFAHLNTFNDDGSAAIKADCNNVAGTYKVNGSDLTITLGASTLMACGDASLDTIYLASLSEVNSYAVVNGQLQLEFANNGGKMDFDNGGAAK